MEYRNAIRGVLAAVCIAVPALAQVKPAESTSKVKKVLRFTKVAGYVHDLGQRDLLAALNGLATAKAFELVNQNTDAILTTDYLKQFQVVIFDNNVGNCVPSTTAREALLNYVNNGGGWLLVHGAGDHQDAWAGLRDALQTKFSEHGSQGPADVVMDKEGLAHKELKWMMDGWPASIRFTRDEWYSFQNSVRGRPNMTVVATAANGGSGVLRPVADGSNDHTYVFAKTMGKGRMLYTALGHGGNEFYSQASGFAAKAFWENMRYVAGDFQNGCTNRNATNFDVTARVDDGSCQPSVGVGMDRGATRATISVVHGEQRTDLNFPHESRFSVEVRNVQGALVWNRAFENVTEVKLDQKFPPGLYYVVAKAGKNVVRHRLTIL